MKTESQMPKILEIKNPIKIWIYTVLIAFAVLVSFSITNSSIAQLNFSGGSKVNGLLLGEPNSIRSDEYLRWTPQFLAEKQFGSSVSLLDYKSGVEYKSTQDSFPKKLIDITGFDFQLKKIVERFLPLDNAFSFNWWMYVFLAIMFIPLFLHLLKVPFSLGIPAASIIFFSPANQWWSNGQIVIMGLAAPAFYFLIRGLENTNRLNKSSIIQLIISGALLAQLPFQYQPWSIPITIFFAAISLVHIYYASNYKKETFKRISIFGVAVFVLVALRIIIDRNSISVLANTIYPGQRRIEITETTYASFSTVLTTRMPEFGPSLKFGNPPEAAISLLEIAFLIALLLPVFVYFRKSSAQAKNLIAASGTLGVFLLWIYGLWPKFFTSANLLTFVSQDRLAQVIGNLAVIALPIFLTFTFKKSIKNLSGLYVYLSVALSLTAFLILREVNNTENVFRIQPYQLQDVYWSIALFVVLIGGLVFIGKLRAVIMWAFVLVFAISAQYVNPIQQGTGDLIESELAGQIQEIELISSGSWVSNSRELDALLIANADELLSGQQLNGPDEVSWQLFDPQNAQQDAWNRGSSFVIFNWTSDPNIYINNPANDVIQVSIDPCNSVLDQFQLKWILANQELNYPCLNKFKSMTNLAGTSYLIYERN